MSNVRYSQLPTDDSTPVRTIQVELVPESRPSSQEQLPEYSSVKFNVQLPTYEEVQQLKQPEVVVDPSTSSDVTDTIVAHPTPMVWNRPLGSDLAFASTFMISFFLYWIGYLCSYCLSTSIAGRCGAVAGFGLCLIKVAFLFKYWHDHGDEEMEHRFYHHYHGWFICLLGILGALSFIHGIAYYVRAKKAYRLAMGN
eukprot:m.9871 g.9871  ORF g.9871 m.9871 type:complete len:197 (-) comp7279_c0_seq1:77-667(-)